jgi:hypothetical protein
MEDQIVRPVCGLCGKIWNAQLDDDYEWYVGWFEDEERDRHYDTLCPECYGVVVEVKEETREWITRQGPAT